MTRIELNVWKLSYLQPQQLIISFIFMKIYKKCMVVIR